MLPLALGTQTGGSIIRPAAFCGVVGVKPSFRLLPTVGVKCYSWALDTLGLFAAGVADAAHALALIADRPAIAQTGEGATPRIGILRQEFCAAPEPEAEAALARAAEAAERAGATIRDLTLPARFGEAFAAHGTLQDYEARQALAWEYAAHRDALPPRLRAALDAAQGIETAAYDDARRTAHHARRGLKEVFSEDGVDVLLTYAAPGAAPAGLDHTGDSRFNRLWTLMGVPCVTLPVDRTPAGLPVGVQVIARFGDDGRALAVAGADRAGAAGVGRDQAAAPRLRRPPHGPSRPRSGGGGRTGSPATRRSPPRAGSRPASRSRRPRPAPPCRGPCRGRSWRG